MATDTLDWVGHSLASGRYRITALLGEGGMGTVYRAQDANLDNEVVVKIPKSGLVSDHEFTARFAREVRSLVRLAHAHIVRVLDVGEYQGLPFAVMQYLNGGSLRDRLSPGRSGSSAMADLASWLPGVADALDYIHLQGYVHRDVKPDNILFDAAGHVYLGDFGIVKALAASEASAGPEATFKTSAGLVVGTPQYMAPELITAQGCDGRVDQYALAVTVYEAVCGQVPFEGRTPASVAVLHATKPPPSPHEVASGIPLAFSTALLRGLAKEPGQRYRDCRSLAQALLAAVPTAGPARRDAAPPAPATEAGKERFTCPHCSQGFRLPPEKRGKSARCPRCGKQFILGARPVAAETASGGMAPTPLASPAAVDDVPVLQMVTPRRAKPPRRPAGHPTGVSSNRLDQPLTVLPADPPRRTLRWILSCAIVVALVMVLLGAGLGMWLRLGNLDNSRGEQGGSVSEGGPASAGDSWIQRARSQHQRGDYAKALDDWDRAVHAAQGNDALTVEGLVGRADTSLAKQDYESAIRDCTQALRLNPQAPHAAALRGIAYLRLKRFDEALAELNRAIDLDPNDARALRERDRVYFERTDYLLTYLPSGCQLIVSARPDQLMKSEVFQELRREIPEFEKVYQSDFDKQQGWLASSDIDQAVFGLSSADLATFVGVSHTKKSITAHDLRARIANVTYTETRVGKYVIHERQDANHQAFCVVDPQCVIVGTKDALSAVLQRDNKPEFSKNLWKALDQVDFSKSVVLAWEISPGLLQGEGDQALLGTNKDLANALKQINSVALQAAVGSDVRIELALFYPAAAAANEGKMGIEAILAQEGNNPALPKEIVALLRLNFQVEGKKVIGRNTIKVGPLIKLFKSKS